MAKAKLDAQYCLTAGCEPGKRKTDHWDIHIPGFVMEARASGSKTFALRYTDARGLQRQKRIGAYGLITADQARKTAAKLRAEVELGGNPQEQKQERKAVPAYSELAEQHLAHARGHLRAPENTERVLRIHILPRWGKVAVNEITTHDLAKWLTEKRQTGLAPATIEKIRVTMGRSFELALSWDMPGVTVNPVRKAPRVRFNNAREKYLTATEAARLIKAVQGSANKQLPHIVGLLLLTGARKMELLRAKREHIDLERRAWHIPTTKTGRPRYVPLSQAAIDIINQLPRWKGCPWLLPNPETREPYHDVKHAWGTAREEAGLPGLRLHDLRHSAASFMINAGIDLYAVGKILGHQDHQSTQRYSHLANDTLMKAVEAGAANLNIDWSAAN